MSTFHAGLHGEEGNIGFSRNGLCLGSGDLMTWYQCNHQWINIKLHPWKKSDVLGFKKKLFHSYSYSHYIHYVPIISPVVSPLGHQFPKQFPAASSVFPVPGGPASSPPRGTRAPAIETCFGGELKCWMRVKFRISMSLQDPPCLFR